MKVCKHTGCPSPIFSNGFCQRHQNDRTDDKWLRTLAKRKEKRQQSVSKFNAIPSPKALSPQNRHKVPPVSKTRLNQAILYKQICDELDREAVNNGTNYCFFCGERIYGDCEHHHLAGRSGSLFTDKRYIVRAHSECHTEIYHRSTMGGLLMQPWFVAWMERLREKDRTSHGKEIRKLKKHLESSIKKYTFDA